MEAEKTLVDKLARLAKSNKELVEKNNQLNKERKDEVARLTSENQAEGAGDQAGQGLRK
jgi:hypothetical protein